MFIIRAYILFFYNMNGYLRVCVCDDHSGMARIRRCCHSYHNDGSHQVRIYLLRHSVYWWMITRFVLVKARGRQWNQPDYIDFFVIYNYRHVLIERRCNRQLAIGCGESCHSIVHLLCVDVYRIDVYTQG